MWKKFPHRLKKGARGTETPSWRRGPREQQPAATCGDVKSQPLSSDPERRASRVGIIQLSTHQSSNLPFTMSLVEIQNVLPLAGEHEAVGD